MSHGHELVESADACALPDGLRACAAEFVCGMTAISSTASSANADEHDPGAKTLTSHSAAEFEGGVTALSPAARRGMEGYVRPYEPDCCPPTTATFRLRTLATRITQFVFACPVCIAIFSLVSSVQPTTTRTDQEHLHVIWTS